MRRTSITIAAIAALLALPAVAMGQGTVFPDNAALDQYVESVPGPTGKTPSGPTPGGGADRGRGAGGPGAAGATLRSGTVSALRALGADGEAVADLAATTAPREPRGARTTGQRARGMGDRPGARDAAAADRDSGIRGVVGQALGGAGEGGMGIVLPLILAAALLAAIAAAAAARRRRRTGSTG